MLVKDIDALLRQHPELNIPHEAYNINVTATTGETLSAAQVQAAFGVHEGAGQPAHLYFHVPLCNYICHFCNYVKKLASTQDREATLDLWVDLLTEESRRSLAAFPWTAKARTQSIYFGGGTAALLSPAQLARLLRHIHDHYDVAPDAEISLEGNPDNLTSGYIEAVQALGFNRFSVGIQSLQDDVTRFVGRKHDRAMSLATIQALRATGLPFNCDYMFGLPYQGVETVRSDIEALAALDVPTITIYRLRNADRAAMDIGNKSAWNNPRVLRAMREQKLFPSLEETYRMRQAIMEVFETHGYQPSPCGWWSKSGVYPHGIPQVSRNKWQNVDTMLAFGPGAYGWLTGGRPDIVQTHNIADINQYMEILQSSDELPLVKGRQLTGYRALATALGFKLKANQWIDLAALREQYGIDLPTDPLTVSVYRELIDRGLVVLSDDGAHIKPSAAGEALHEEMISVYIHERIGGLAEKVCKRA